MVVFRWRLRRSRFAKDLPGVLENDIRKKMTLFGLLNYDVKVQKAKQILVAFLTPYIDYEKRLQLF